MSDINKEYFVLQCGSGKVPSPYIACTKEHYLIYRNQTSFYAFAQIESPADEKDNIPLIEAMEVSGGPLISSRIKDTLMYFDIYKLQLLPAIYTHSDNVEHIYWLMLIDNEIPGYSFELSKYYSVDDGDVNAENIRLDKKIILNSPLEKRLIFEIPGMRATYLIHESITEALRELNASGLHLVPLLEWDDGFCMSI